MEFLYPAFSLSQTKLDAINAFAIFMFQKQKQLYMQIVCQNAVKLCKTLMFKKVSPFENDFHNGHKLQMFPGCM